MERAHYARRPQPALAHPRMCVSADVIERMDPFTSVANEDLPPGQGGGTHAALGNVAEGHEGLENGLAHSGRGCDHIYSSISVSKIDTAWPMIHTPWMAPSLISSSTFTRPGRCS